MGYKEQKEKLKRAANNANRTGNGDYSNNTTYFQQKERLKQAAQNANNSKSDKLLYTKNWGVNRNTDDRNVYYNPEDIPGYDNLPNRVGNKLQGMKSYISGSVSPVSQMAEREKREQQAREDAIKMFFGGASPVSQQAMMHNLSIKAYDNASPGTQQAMQRNAMLARRDELARQKEAALGELQGNYAKTQYTGDTRYAENYDKVSAEYDNLNAYLKMSDRAEKEKVWNYYRLNPDYEGHTASDDAQKALQKKYVTSRSARFGRTEYVEGGVATINGFNDINEVMTEEQQKTYAYLYDTMGEEKANQYFEDIYAGLETRQAKDYVEMLGEMADAAPGLANAVSVATNLIGGVQGTVGEALYDIITGNEINGTGLGFANTLATQEIRDRVSKDYTPLGKFFYQTAMSMADSLATMPMGDVGTVLMSMSSASSTASEMAQKGASAKQIVLSSVIAGAIEYATEHSGLERVTGYLTNGIPTDVALSFKNNLVQTLGVIARETGSAALAEGGEEVLSSIGNMIADQLINGNNSDLQKLYQQLLAEGMSEQEASKAVWAEIAKEIGTSFAGGALSGGVMSGGAMTLNVGISDVLKRAAQDMYGNEATTNTDLAEDAILNPVETKEDIDNEDIIQDNENEEKPKANEGKIKQDAVNTTPVPSDNRETVDSTEAALKKEKAVNGAQQRKNTAPQNLTQEKTQDNGGFIQNTTARAEALAKSYFPDNDSTQRTFITAYNRADIKNKEQENDFVFSFMDIYGKAKKGDGYIPSVSEKQPISSDTVLSAYYAGYNARETNEMSQQEQETARYEIKTAAGKELAGILDVSETTPVLYRDFTYNLTKNGNKWGWQIYRGDSIHTYATDARKQLLSDAFYDAKEAAIDNLIETLENNRLIMGDTNESTQEEIKNAEKKPGQTDTGRNRTVDEMGQDSGRILVEEQESDVQEVERERGPSADPARDSGERRQTGTQRSSSGRSRRTDVGGTVTEAHSEDSTPNITAEAETPTEKIPVSEPEKIIERKSSVSPKGNNYIIPDDFALPTAGEKVRRFENNLEAIRIAKALKEQDRFATPDEQAKLAQFVGWGGLAEAFDERTNRNGEWRTGEEWKKRNAQLKELLTPEEYSAASHSTTNAHYTSGEVIKAIYTGLEKLGYKGGKILEPSSGIGNFVGWHPKNMNAQWTMIELDNLTSDIGHFLYPNAYMLNMGFQDANIPNDYYDLAISNVPFSEVGVVDRDYKQAYLKANLHNYFFVKAIDKVKPGGMLAFITSRYTMDSTNVDIRKYLNTKADFVGAVRLPKAFKDNAATDVITDIIFLKKRDIGTEYAGEDWVKLDNIEVVAEGRSYPNTYKINEYFVNHPEMVLGKAVVERGMYSYGLGYESIGDNLGEQIEEAIGKINAKIEYRVPEHATPPLHIGKKGEASRKNAMTIENGEVFTEVNGEKVKIAMREADVQKLERIFAIRDKAKELINLQLEASAKNKITAARKQLNELYDSFAAEYASKSTKNPATLRSLRKLYNTDVDAGFIEALENYNADTKATTKADIFFRNVVTPNNTINTVSTPMEALYVSMNTLGRVDIDRMSELTGINTEEIVSELTASNVIFKTINGTYETAEEFLSGNVRAKIREYEKYALYDADLERNIEALKEVVPKDLTENDILATPGMTWIPASVYEDFISEIMGVPEYARTNRKWTGRAYEDIKTIEVTLNPITSKFEINVSSDTKKWYRTNASEYSTSRRTFDDLFADIINTKSIVVRDKLEDGKYVINEAETRAANETAEKIKRRFNEWIWQDENRKSELLTIYNEIFNSIVTPKYDGSHLTVNGFTADPSIKLRPHQLNSIQRWLTSKNNLMLQHLAGAGKTATVASICMKGRELGFIRKPVIVCKKKLLQQWNDEFYKFYPGAKVLSATNEGMSAKNRDVFINKIMTGDWDAIIMTYENFTALPVSAEIQTKFLEKQKAEALAAKEEAKRQSSGKGMTVKKIEKTLDQIDKRLKEILDSKKDETIPFDALGIDALFVDEAQNYKNLYFFTSLDRIKGLGSSSGNKRAADMFMKTNYLNDAYGYGRVIMATATPVMNTMTELYTMQRYLQYDELKRLGIDNLDAWIANFAMVTKRVEQNPTGTGQRVVDALAKFKNVPDLMRLWLNVSDVVENIPAKLPVMKTGKYIIVEADMSPEQKAYMKTLDTRARNIKNSGKPEKGADNMLNITTDGRKMAYTIKMIDNSAPYEPGCKVLKLVDNVADIYKRTMKNKSTQMIFIDLATPKPRDTTKDLDEIEAEIAEQLEESERGNGFDMYEDIRSFLVSKGVKREEIAFIHEAKNDDQAKRLFEKVNKGEVRVIIGSTAKMAEGVNVQNKLIALHHLDAPWRPGDMEQRDRRIIRQGNENDEVEIYTYVTKGSFDKRMWDLLKNKSIMINSIMHGDTSIRQIDDISDFTLSASEVMAVASGNPLLVEQAELTDKIRTLTALKADHQKQISNAKYGLAKSQATANEYEDAIPKIEIDIKNWKDTTGDLFKIVVAGKNYTDRKKAGKALLQEAGKVFADIGADAKQIGSINGFMITAKPGTRDVTVSGAYTYTVTLSESETGSIRSIELIKSRMETIIKNMRDQTAMLENNIRKYKATLDSKFDRETELESAVARNNEIAALLSEENAGSQSAETTEESETLNRTVEERDDDWNAKANKDIKQSDLNGVSEIIAKFRRKFNVNVTTGHIRGKKSILGSYANNTEGIRLRIANDLPTFTHELGHHIDNTLKLYENADKNVRAELAHEGEKADKKNVKEGIAEFFRMYMQNKENAVSSYPQFAQYIKEAIPEDEMNLIDELANDINAYYVTDSETAQSSIRSLSDKPKDFRSIREKTNKAMDMFYQNAIDRMHGIRLFDKTFGTNTYASARNSAYADSIAAANITGKLHDDQGHYVTDGLKDFLPERYFKDAVYQKTFGEYLIVKHGPERLATRDGLRVFADERKNTAEWMERRQASLEEQYPEFIEMSENLYEWIKALYRTWGVETGVISQETMDNLNERWQYYVPLNRAIDIESANKGTKRSFGNQNSPIKRATGSGLDIINPVDSLIKNASELIQLSILNKVAVNIRNAVKNTDGDTALFMEQIPEPLSMQRFDMSGIKDTLESEIETAELTPDQKTKVSEMFNGSIPDLLTQYVRKGRTAEKDVITILINGEKEYWKINDQMLFESLQNVSPRETNVILRALAAAGRFTRGMLTGLNPIFTLTSNLPRDMQTAALYASGNRLDYIKNLLSAYKDTFASGKLSHRNQYYEEYDYLGGGNDTVYSADRNIAKNAYEKLNKTFALNKLNPFMYFELIGNIVESSPRKAFYAACRKNGLSPEEAMLAAHDLTVDFRRSGINIKGINSIIPFFNAGLQSTDKMLRYLSAEGTPSRQRGKEAAKRTIEYLVCSALVAALMYAINHADEEKEEEYETLSNYTKNTFWCIPIGDGKYLTIPKAQGLSVITSIFERTYDAIFADDKEAFDDVWEYITNNLLPNAVSNIAQGDIAGPATNISLIGPFISMYANKDFMGKPIIPESMDNYLPKDQFNEKTSVPAKWIGEGLGLSPIKIDYFLQNTLGGVWKGVKAIFPVGSKYRDFSLGIGSAYIRDSQFSTDVINNAYDFKTQLTREYNSDPQSIKKLLDKKLAEQITKYYSNYYALAKTQNSNLPQNRAIRQKVLLAVEEMNKYFNGGDLSSELKAVYEVALESGNEAILPAAMTNRVSVDGNIYTMTAAQYVEYQQDYINRYYSYVDDALSVDLPKGVTRDMMIMAAKQKAYDEAKDFICAKLGIGTDEKKQSGYDVSNEDDILFKAAYAAALNNDENGSINREEIISLLNSLDGLDNKDRAYFYQSSNSTRSVYGNVYLTPQEMNEYIRKDIAGGKDPKDISASIKRAYKESYQKAYLNGDSKTMREIETFMLALTSLRKEDGTLYITRDVFDTWRKNVRKTSD